MTTFEELHWQTVSALESLASQSLNIGQVDGQTNTDAQKDKDSDMRTNFLEAYSKAESKQGNESDWQGIEIFELERCQKESQQVRMRLDASMKALAALKLKYEAVAEKTSSLHEACDQLMSDQTQLASSAEEIRSRMAYFDHAEQIIQKLGSPHFSVTGESFTHLLSSIDDCLKFLQENPEYKECSLFISKYKQCLSRALSAVKSHFTHQLHETTANVRMKMNSASGATNEDSFTLLYGVFATHAQTLRPLMATLEQKWDTFPEYESILSDCYQAYFTVRHSLLLPSVNSTVQQLLTKYARSSCTLIRTGCAFLLRVCEDEYRLFFQFFTRPTEQLHEMTWRLCRVFYDSVRSAVIHINHLETLAELCTVLKLDLLEERCAIEGDVYDGFIHFATELHGDVAERLVYRANAYAQDDILGYKPSPGDLAYPEKLQMMQEIVQKSSTQTAATATVAVSDSGQQHSSVSIEKTKTDETDMSNNETAASTEKNEADTTVVVAVGSPLSPSNPLSAVDLHGLWYPTVRRAVLCLSKLFKCVDPAVFQGVSQEVLTNCVQSLHYAADQIALTKFQKPLDAQLFLVKHLLILREQTNPFRSHMAFGLKDTSLDFSKLKDSALTFMNHKSRWFALSGNNAFLEFLLQVPAHVSESFTDGRRVLDSELKRACQKLITICSDGVVLEINDFLQKADVILRMSNEEGGNKLKLSKQPFATPDSLQKLVAQSFRKLKETCPHLKRSFDLFIANRDTENILFTPIKKRIVECFERLSSLVSVEYSDEEQKIVSLPSTPQINLTLISLTEQQQPY